MTREEMKAVMTHKRELVKISKNVTALYLLSDMTEVWIYLWAKIDDNCLTEDEADAIVEQVNSAWADRTCEEIERIKELF